jgi:hypothetical protein
MSKMFSQKIGRFHVKISHRPEMAFREYPKLDGYEKKLRKMGK